MPTIKELEIILLFDEIRILGKIGTIIQNTSSNIVVEKFFDPQQILSYEFDNSHKNYILITEGQFLETLSDYDINPILFEEIINIDEEQKTFDFNTHYINPKLMHNGLVAKMNDLILTNYSDSDFMPISLKDNIVGKEYPCEFFIRLNNDKYVKITSVNDLYDQEIADKYKNKNITTFYIHKSDYDAYSKVNQKKKTVFKKKEEAVDVTINAIESLHTYTKDLGISPKVIEQAKSLHKDIEKYATNKAMKNIFNKLKNLEGSFLYNHSYVCATIALTVGKNFNWFTIENQEKVYMGSMFHDIGYKDENNALHEHLKLSEIKRLNQDEKDDVLEHTSRYAQAFASMPNIHQDVINMMVRHHGIHEQDSYPKKIYQTEVSLIFALFIISHEFTVKLFKASFNKSKIPQILEEIETQFNKGNYKSILPAFKSSVTECFLTN